MSTLSTSATATPAAAVDSCKATESPRDISSGNNNEDSEKSKSTNSQDETLAATASGKRKININEIHGNPEGIKKRRYATDIRIKEDSPQGTTQNNSTTEGQQNKGESKDSSE
ncbi:MAG: hypothetical protein MHMPM18_004068, partial [Marteilia pararefringens]